MPNYFQVAKSYQMALLFYWFLKLADAKNNRMNKKALIRWPRLVDKRGDLNQKWYIVFSVRNPKTDKMEVVKKHAGLHKIKSLKERYAKAEELKLYWTQRLKSGWVPWDESQNTEVTYVDTLEYVHVAKMFGDKRKSNKTFHYFAAKFIDQLTRVSSSTISTYTSKLRIFNQWLTKHNLHDNDISSIDNSLIQSFFFWLIKEQKRSRVTINKYNQIISCVFDYAIGVKYLKSNPVFDVPEAEVTCDEAARPIQEYDIPIFLKAFEESDPQLGLATRFMFNCFLRPKEIQHMKIKWIDFAAGTITVPKHLFKTRHDRVTVIPEAFLFELREKYQLMQFPKEYYIIGNTYSPAPSYWKSENSMRRRHNTIREKLNMPIEYKYYSWKHSGNVRAERDDIAMVERQNQNGHLHYSTTERYTRNKIGTASKTFRNKFTALGY